MQALIVLWDSTAFKVYLFCLNIINFILIIMLIF